MAQPAVHQFLTGLIPGDAISNHALSLQRYLRAWGYVSEIYTTYRDPQYQRAAHDYRSYHGDEDLLIYHYSIGSPLTAFLLPFLPRVILHYHNITPAELFRVHSPQFRRELEQGRAELALLRDVPLAVAVSDYNRRELAAIGYRQTKTASVIIDFERLNLPGEGRWRDGEVNWLFVGRIAPNKRQDELIALFAYYQHWVEPHARLILVGSAEHAPSYQLELEVQADVLRVKSKVKFTGRVSDAELATCYRSAHVYVSLSEHEGFGVPLLEALNCGVPVVAYATAAIPDTLADAGILFHQKNWAVLAELIDRVVKDEALRAQLIAQGRQRAAQFAAETVAAQWQAIIQTLTEKR